MQPIRIVVAPNSFKGSLGAPEAADIIGSEVSKVIPNSEIIRLPMADGGEGTLDVLLGRDGTRRTAYVHTAAGNPCAATFGLINRNGARAAVVEAAQIVGITDKPALQTDVQERSTFGLGQLFKLLLDEDVRRFYLGLGGTSTNDAGAGMLTALGLELEDARGRRLPPTPRGLAQLHSVDASRLDRRLFECDLICLTDVQNPLCGAAGATAVFGPQKGVSPGEVACLDRSLLRFAVLAEQAVGREARLAPGAGAAGGLGFAARLIGGAMQSGAQTVADLIGLDAALEGAAWALTGEGRSDMQTLLGKGPIVVAERAKRKFVPTTLISGSVDAAAIERFAAHFPGGYFACIFAPSALEQLIARAPLSLAKCTEQVARAFLAGRSAPR